MRSLYKLLLWLTSAALVVVAVYLWASREHPPLAEKMVQAPAAARSALLPAAPGPAPPATPQDAQSSSSAAEPDPSLPPLTDSDEALSPVLDGLLGHTVLRELLASGGLLQRLVVTIDNLPASRLPLRLRLWQPLPGPFLTEGEETSLVLSPRNAGRYAPYVQAFLAIDPEALVAMYRRWYPLLQQAYAEIGPAHRLFKDRLIEVLDHLTAVTVPVIPPALVRPGVLYRYADQALENQSAGARLLVRMGPELAARVQGRLRLLRQMLTAAPGQATRR